jgi:hypothetical protein
VELVTRDGEELVTRDGDVLRSRGQSFTASDSILSIDLGEIEWIGFVIVNFSEITSGKRLLNVFTSTDNVNFEPLYTPFDDILRSLVVGTDRRVAVGRRARYVALRFQPVGLVVQSNFVLDKFDVLGGDINE